MLLGGWGRAGFSRVQVYRNAPLPPAKGQDTSLIQEYARQTLSMLCTTPRAGTNATPLARSSPCSRSRAFEKRMSRRCVSGGMRARGNDAHTHTQHKGHGRRGRASGTAALLGPMQLPKLRGDVQDTHRQARHAKRHAVKDEYLRHTRRAREHHTCRHKLSYTRTHMRVHGNIRVG